MAKFNIKTTADIVALKSAHNAEPDLAMVAGDIIVHKPFEFYIVQGHLKRYYSDTIVIVPAGPGTEVYTVNGYNTSVIKSI